MSRTESFVEGTTSWGSNDLNTMFPENAATTGVPWKRAARSKRRQSYDRSLVEQELSRPVSGPEALVDVDPRNLQATQPNITRAGVSHYLKDEYETTGQTFADRGNVGNQFPFVYSRQNAEGPPDEMLLSGHHRAAASMLKGKPLRARRIEGPWGAER